MANEMIERVQAALRAALKRTDAWITDLDEEGRDIADGLGETYNGRQGVVIDGAVLLDDLARAAIEAMREPTDAMSYSGSWAVGPGGDRAKKAELAKAYAAMIDAALSSTPPPHKPR
jgi:hypothetical protein